MSDLPTAMPTFQQLCAERHTAIEDELQVALDYIALIGCEETFVDFASTHWLLRPEPESDLDSDD